MKRPALGWYLAAVIVSLLLASFATAQPRPTPCTPRAQLTGRDTSLALLPCRDLARLDATVRPAVECTLARLQAGGWDAMLFETYRSEDRQRFLYSYGRTRPGPRVTNAKSARTSAHGTGYAADIIHRTRHWNHPRFFYWLGQHAEACGLEAGVFWQRFPDGPHVQSATWRRPS